MIETVYTIAIVIAALIGIYDGIQKTKSKTYRLQKNQEYKQLANYFILGK